MKKSVLSFSVIIAFAFYAFFSTSKSIVVSQPTNSTSDLNTTLPLSDKSNSKKMKDGVYNGTVEDVYYGNIEVKATIASGKLTNVQFLQYPNDKDNSIKISQRAMPILKSEAIKSQSANVDIVSGATETSAGFIKSLGNALAQAQK
jgi:uncharacterized protein with FMN-binding domain